MNKYIKRIVESIFDDEEDFEDELSGEFVNNKITTKSDTILYLAYPKALLYFEEFLGIPLSDNSDAASIYYNLGLILRKVNTEDLFNEDYLLNINFNFILVLDNEYLELTLTILDIFYNTIKCKVCIFGLEYYYSSSKFNIENPRISFNYINYYSLYFKTLDKVCPYINETVQFMNCKIDSCTGLRVDHPIGFSFNKSMLPLDWTGFPNNLMHTFYIVFKHENINGEKTIKYGILTLLRSLKNFPLDITVINTNTSFGKTEEDKGLNIMQRSWSNEDTEFYKQYIKQIILRDFDNKLDRNKAYKLFTNIR